MEDPINVKKTVAASSANRQRHICCSRHAGRGGTPVLAGSAAYAVSESFDWQSGLDRKVHEALEFYGIIAIATVGGVALNFTHLDPMRALVWSAQINGVIAVPIMAVMMLLASREDIMGRFVIRPRLQRLGWIATAVMTVGAVMIFVTWNSAS